jgi:hypothetical protein
MHYCGQNFDEKMKSGGRGIFVSPDKAVNAFTEATTTPLKGPAGDAAQVEAVQPHHHSEITTSNCAKCPPC